MEPCIASGSCGSLSSTRTTTSSPCRTLSKLRICATISKKDEQQNHCFPIDHGIIIEGKTYPKSIFEHVFREETSQTEIESAFLSDMINMVIGGSDATILAMGAKSIGKDEKLYGDNSNRNGLVQLAISKLMTTLEEKKSCEERVQVRMSAVLISQNNETIVDILSPFNPDPRHRVVKVVDSPRVGVFLENESEIRVESVDQALFYLNTAVDHRLIQEDQTYRTSHVFISFSLYSYKMSETQMEGGRRRLSFLDMGIGERNSTNGGMTMPALGSVLMAMVQKNKHVPFRDTKVCQIIRCALSTSRFTTFIFSFGPKNDDNENIAHLACKIARTRVKNFSAQSRKSIAANSTSDATSSTDTRSKKTVESGSELSAAETVIFLGPSTSPSKSSGLISPISTPSHRPLHRTSRSVDKDLTKELVIETKSQSSPAHSCHSSCVNSIPPMLKGHTPFLSSSLKLYDELCSPTGTPSQVSPNAFGGISLEDRNDFGVMIATPSLPPKSSSKTRYNLDDGKRKQILQWMENSEAPPILFQTPCFDSSSLGGSSNSSGEEVRDCVGGILSHPLEDIIEIEEESLRTSTATTSKDHPLRILSKNNLIEKIDNLASVNQRKETAENKEVEGEDENDLELVMAASLSSMKSHDILAKLETMRSTQSGGVPILTESMTTNGDASEMNVYRRASHLEEYAMMKIKEMEENKLKKKRAKMGLNCCQQSMLSSSSTTMDWNQLEMKIDQEKLNIEEEQRKDALRERRAMLKITELELKKERSLIDKELDDKKTLANSIARQLQHFSLSPCRGNSNSSRLKQRSISSHRIDPPIGSLPSTPTMSQRKITNGSLTNRTHWSSQSTTTHQSLPRQTKTSTSSRKTSIERKISSGKDRKPTVDNSTIISKEKKLSSNGSKEELCWRSPYSHMTSPKTYGGPGTSSSGRGSSAPGSEFEPIGHRRSAASSANIEREYNKSSVINDGGSKNEKETKSKRQSYSASSGYESANDYHICSKQSIFDKRMNEEKLNFVRQKDTIKQRQYKLKKDLESAKKAIGQAEDDKMVGTKHFDNNKRLNGLNRTTLIDTLLQENRILEKRIVAARNHSMFVTTFI